MGAGVMYRNGGLQYVGVGGHSTVHRIPEPTSAALLRSFIKSFFMTPLLHYHPVQGHAFLLVPHRHTAKPRQLARHRDVTATVTATTTALNGLGP